MAGHNKWSKIRHKKGAKDVKRSKILGKASLSVTAASRDCDGDLSNLRLQSAIAHAKAVQLPKERLEEAIEKGTQAYRHKKGAGAHDWETLRFDAMMRIVVPADDGDEEETAQVAFVITALSDNRNRTTQQIRHLVSKTGGELLPTDNLKYLFQQVGVILVEQEAGDVIDANDNDFEDALMEAALEAGAINVEELEEEEEGESDDTTSVSDEESNNNTSRKAFIVTTEERALWQVVQALKEGGYNVSQFEHRYILQDEHGSVDLSPKAWELLEELLEKMEDLEDVNHVYHNAS
jgi:transcriptional/translational regulatory protein YebC/TACO1